MAVLFIILGILAITAASVIWRGYVLSILWGWFMVPAFALPHLSIPIAIGISIVISYLTHQHGVAEKESRWAEALGTAFMGPFMALLLGWIVTFFI